MSPLIFTWIVYLTGMAVGMLCMSGQHPLIVAVVATVAWLSITAAIAWRGER